MANKKTKGKQCLNLYPGKIGRILLVHKNPVNFPKDPAIQDKKNTWFVFNVIDLNFSSDSRATIRFTIDTTNRPAPAPGAAAAPDLPTDGSLSITLVDGTSGGDIPVELETPIAVDYVDDPEDP